MAIDLPRGSGRFASDGISHVESHGNHSHTVRGQVVEAAVRAQQRFAPTPRDPTEWGQDWGQRFVQAVHAGQDTSELWVEYKRLQQRQAEVDGR